MHGAFDILWIQRVDVERSIALHALVFAHDSHLYLAAGRSNDGFSARFSILAEVFPSVELFLGQAVFVGCSPRFASLGGVNK